MLEEESCVLRIVNLDESFAEEALRKLILIKCQPNGDIKNIYLKRENRIPVSYGYIVFEHSYDAKKVKEILNGYVHTTKPFEVELIGPNLEYRIYPEIREYSYDDATCYKCRVIHRNEKCPFDVILKRAKLKREKTLRTQLFSSVGGGRIRSRFEFATNAGSSQTTWVKAGNPSGPSMGWREGTSYANIYITNISPSMTDLDLKKIVEPFGPRLKHYLGKDKLSGACKGFAYVNFKFRSDAMEAMSSLNGHMYDNRPLKVEWSKT